MNRSLTTTCRASRAGRITLSTNSARLAMNNSASARGEIFARDANRIERSSFPKGVPPGSAQPIAGTPRAFSHSTSSRHWVDLPVPSMPSSEMKVAADMRLRCVGLPRYHLVRVVARSYERPGDHLAEPEPPGRRRDRVELGGRYEPGYRNVFERRRQVLPEGQDFAPDVAHIGDDVEKFADRLPDAEHETAFRGNRRIPVLDASQQVKAAAVIGLATHLAIKPRNGFQIVVIDLGPGLDHAVDGCRVANEVRGEHLDGRPRPLANCQHATVEMVRAAVRQVVARHRGDHDVLQPQSRRRLRHALRFVGLDIECRAARDRTESARARAYVSEDHERRGPAGVALGAVWAAGIFAHCFQPQVAQQRVGEEVLVAPRQRSLEPGGKSVPGRLRLQWGLN